MLNQLRVEPCLPVKLSSLILSHTSSHISILQSPSMCIKHLHKHRRNIYGDIEEEEVVYMPLWHVPGHQGPDKAVILLCLLLFHNYVKRSQTETMIIAICVLPSPHVHMHTYCAACSTCHAAQSPHKTDEPEWTSLYNAPATRAIGF